RSMAAKTMAARPAYRDAELRARGKADRTGPAQARRDQRTRRAPADRKRAPEDRAALPMPAATRRSPDRQGPVDRRMGARQEAKAAPGVREAVRDRVAAPDRAAGVRGAREAATPGAFSRPSR